MKSSDSSLRDQGIDERLAMLCRDACVEGEQIRPASITQLVGFLTDHPWIGLPKITLTPDGTLRARWIAASGDFTAIEFTGTAFVKLLAEVQRGTGTAKYCRSELVSNVARVAGGLGAPLTCGNFSEVR